MMTSSYGNIFRVTGPLCGEFTGHRWIPLTKASDAELWGFLSSAPEQSVMQIIETPEIETPSRSLWRHCNDTILVHYPVVKSLPLIWRSDIRRWILRVQRDVKSSGARSSDELQWLHDDVIKWKHFPRYWPFVRGIHRSPVNSPHKGQWRGALMFSLICVGLNGWINNREAGDLRRYRAHDDVTVM